MSSKFLVIVESPTKAKTIRKFLPKNFIVEASMGHVRDLPQSATDIPAKLKQEEWTKIGVNVANDFEPLYVVPKGKSKIIQDLKKKLEKVDELYLATDEDREGESISWHLVQLLKPKVPVKRMVFHEITKSAIQNALKDTRKIDQRLVHAQETRRVLDRLVGYTLSPLIWKKIAYGLSAGRVQSAGLKLLAERERERMAFRKAYFWDIKAELGKNGKTFEAKLLSLDGKRIATSKDFDENTGKLSKPDAVLLIDEKKAKELTEKLKKDKWIVESVEEKTFQSKPAPPFITSTLQQESNRKLGLSAKETMRTAQRLYEEGLITYMRTDSPNLSSQAISGARSTVEELYGKEFLSPEPRQYSSKSKGAQEAHEAIRPAGETFSHPQDTGLSGKELALYELIWKRTIATQMAEAKKLSVSIKVKSGDALFNATGSRIIFPGFLRAYVEGSDDPEAALENQEVILPEVKQGDDVKLSKLEPLSHETKPPARFTEASIVQRLEKEGIGRPSTYATIIGTIIDRGYAKKQGNALVPSFTGITVIQLLEKHFSELVDYKFTSEMEETLDEIAEGTKEHLPYLKKFYLGKTGLLEQVKQKEKLIDPDESRTVNLAKLENIEVKVGRFGAYLIKTDPNFVKPPKEKKKKVAKGEKEEKKETATEKKAKTKKETGEIHASIPEDIAPAELTLELINEIIEASEKGPEPIGVHPETKENIYVFIGRYGPYVQLGEATEEIPKPKRSGVPKGVDYKTLSLEQAVHILSLPRTLGEHPETKKPIITNIGRFGAYINHDGEYRSIKNEDSPYTITLSRALEVLKEEKKVRGKILKSVQHPLTRKKINVMEGKFGPYIKVGARNLSFAKDMNYEKMSDEAIIAFVDEEIGTGKKKKKTK